MWPARQVPSPVISRPSASALAAPGGEELAVQHPSTVASPADAASASLPHSVPVPRSAGYYPWAFPIPPVATMFSGTAASLSSAPVSSLGVALTMCDHLACRGLCAHRR